MLLECFVYTNGRSTYDYCMQYLQLAVGEVGASELSRKIRVFRDVKLVDAVNRTLDICQAAYFIKVDDDFILHPLAIKHMVKCLCTPIDRNIAMYDWHLWEVWTNRVISGIKIYSIEALKSIGGFTADSYAKFDKTTNIKLEEAGFKLQKDSSVLGLHACGTWKEQRRYEELWSNAAKFEYEKSTHIEQKRYNVPISEQVKFLDTGFLDQLNRKNYTLIYDWSGKKQRDDKNQDRKNRKRAMKIARARTRNTKLPRRINIKRR